MKIFISHSVKGDPPSEKIARELFEALEKENFEPFLDLERLKIGDDWEPILRGEIGESDAAVLLLSRKAAEHSEWVAREIVLIKVRAGQSPAFPILPLFLGDLAPEEVKKGRLAHLDLNVEQGIRVLDRPDWLKQVLGKLDASRHGVLDTYLAAVEIACERLPYESASPSNELPQLSGLYVARRVQQEPGRPSDPGQSKDGSTGQRSVTIEELLATPHHVVLEGGAGTGKSTILRHIALQLIQNWRSGQQHEFLPALVTARTFAPRKASVSESVRLDVEESLGRLLPAPIAPDFFERPPTRKARWFVMVDGLDEILDSGERDRLIKDLVDIPTRNSGYRFMVTSRPIGTRGFFAGGDFDVHRLLPFTSADAHSFAQHWFDARKGHDPKTAEEFVSRMESSRVGDFLANPLLLTMAATVYQPESSQSYSRTALYGEFVAKLLDREEQGRKMRARIRGQWEHARGAEGVTTADLLFNNRHDILLHLALHTRTGGARPLAEEALEYCRQTGWISAAADPGALSRMESFLERTGLVVGYGARQAFIHTTFADYLNAAALAQEIRTDAARRREVVNRWSDPAESEVVLFLLGIWCEAHDDLNTELRHIARSDPAGARFCGLAIAEGVVVSSDLEEEIIQELLAQTRALDWKGLARFPSAPSVLGLLKGRDSVRTGLLELARGEAMKERLRGFTADALGRLGCIEDLRELSIDPAVAPRVRLQAAAYLARVDLTAAERVIAAIGLSSSTEVYLRMDAIRVLADLGLTRAAQSLVPYLFLEADFDRSPYWPTRAGVLFGQLGRTEEGVELLLSALYEPDVVTHVRLLEDDFAESFGALGAVQTLLAVRETTARPDEIAHSAIRWLYRSGHDQEGSEVLAKILAQARRDGVQAVHPGEIFREVEDEKSLARVVKDPKADDNFRAAAVRHLEAVASRRRREQATGLARLFNVMRFGKSAVFRNAIRTLADRLERLNGPLEKRYSAKVTLSNVIRLLGKRLYLKYLSRIVRSSVPSADHRTESLAKILREGDQELWLEGLWILGMDPKISDWMRADYAQQLFKYDKHERGWQVLTANALYKSAAMDFFRRLPGTVGAEVALVLVDRVVHDKNVSAQVQSEAIKSFTASEDESFLPSVALDDSLKTWVRVLAARQLAAIHGDFAIRLCAENELDIWGRVEAANQLGRSNHVAGLLTVASNSTIDVRVRRFAAWWVGRLEEPQADELLRALEMSEHDPRLLAALGDARTMLELRALVNAPAPERVAQIAGTA
jgi:hypothetical protein